MAQQRSWDIVTGPGITALGIAATRSVESSMPDALIDDPFAAVFVDAVGLQLPLPLRWPAPGEQVTEQEARTLHTSRYIGVRSRFYDDFIRAAVQGGAGQVVLIAAGLDTRAFRLSWPAGVTVYELDQPRVLDFKNLDFKNDVLQSRNAQPRCRRVTVGVDLRENWSAALVAAGFTAAVPTVWVAEGLLCYLPAAAEADLLRRIHQCSAPGSSLVLDHFADLGKAAHELDELSLRSGIDIRSLYNTEPRPYPARWLRLNGWAVHEADELAVARRYGRDLTDPFTGQNTRPWQETVFLTGELAHPGGGQS